MSCLLPSPCAALTLSMPPLSTGLTPRCTLFPLARWLQNSFDLLLLASAMREEGYLPASLSLWAVENPMLAPVDRLQQKADAGAEVILTQPPLLWEPTAAWAEEAAARRVSEHVKVGAGWGGHGCRAWCAKQWCQLWLFGNSNFQCDACTMTGRCSAQLGGRSP